MSIKKATKNLLVLIIAINALASYSQENLPYQKPSNEILELVDVNLAPRVLIDNDNKNMVFLYRDSFKTIEELSREELRLGGLRIDPKTNIGSRTTYYNNIKLKYMDVTEPQVVDVNGLPDNPKLANFRWSPDQKKIAFTNTSDKGVSLWVLDIKSATAVKLTNDNINANLRDAVNWFKDSNSLLIKTIPPNRKELINSKTTVPTGPTISVSDGKKAQNRTYQDLLKNKNDEYNFEQLSLSNLTKVGLNGEISNWLDVGMYTNISFSPDGEFVMVSSIEKPFSYLVTYYRFPTKTNIYTKDGEFVENVLSVPLLEDLPKGFMATRKGRRNLMWRGDKPSTIVFAVALDGGDPKKVVDYRDEVFELEYPFNGEPVSLIKTINRFSNITWGNDYLAVAADYWWNTRNTKVYTFNPSDNKTEPVVLFDRNYQDEYSNPGSFVMKRSRYNTNVLSLEGNNAFLIGDGFSEEGQFPFIDEINLVSHEKSRLYQSEYKNKLESIIKYIPDEKQLLVRVESPTEYPNYYFRQLNKSRLTQLTFFQNPFSSLQNVHKEVISYKRDDGLELSGTLYLPVGYNKDSKERLPMILWAYPREFKDKSSASQNTSNPNAFTYPYYGSPIYWLAKGYVILDNAAFPIVGEGNSEPNDSFRKQLVANAKAAIDAVDSLGYIDRNKVAVGGHSYGAFMVANLLSHSDLFAAGIARSGAYNRTLTPFGFQSEERSYWEAPEVYYNMSPFMHADKMKTPLLLIHGEADNNSGTYPMQSERYFNALKGLGAPVRLVILPKESHGYRAKESILHLLWEQDQWLENNVKNRRIYKPQPSSE